MPRGRVGSMVPHQGRTSTSRGPVHTFQSISWVLNLQKPNGICIQHSSLEELIGNSERIRFSGTSEMASTIEESNGQLAAGARALAAVARRIKTGVGLLAASGAVAALFLWTVLWWPPSLRLLPLLGAGATLVAVLLPPTILVLFYQGLHDLLALPERVSDRAARTVKESTESLRTFKEQEGGLFSRTWAILKHIWTLRSMLSENRALLVRYGSMIRFVTPGFLLVATVAALISVILILLAGGVGLLALLGGLGAGWN